MATELAGKRLDLLHELVPAAAVVALLVNPTNTANRELETSSLRDVANSLGLQLHVLSASSADEIDVAFATFAELRASALVVSVDPLLHEPAQANRRAGGPPCSTGDLRMA